MNTNIQKEIESRLAEADGKPITLIVKTDGNETEIIQIAADVSQESLCAILPDGTRDTGLSLEDAAKYLCEKEPATPTMEESIKKLAAFRKAHMDEPEGPEKIGSLIFYQEWHKELFGTVPNEWGDPPCAKS